MSKAPAIYIYLQFKLAEYSDRKDMSRDMARGFLRHYRLPKGFREQILVEMEQFGLLRVKLDKVKVINCKISNEMEFKSRITRRKLFEQKALNTC